MKHKTVQGSTIWHIKPVCGSQDTLQSYRNQCQWYELLSHRHYSLSDSELQDYFQWLCTSSPLPYTSLIADVYTCKVHATSAQFLHLTFNDRNSQHRLNWPLSGGTVFVRCMFCIQKLAWDGQTDSQTDGQKGQAGRQAGRQIGKQTETNRQTNRQTKTERETDRRQQRQRQIGTCTQIKCLNRPRSRRQVVSPFGIHDKGNASETGTIN